MNFKYCYAVCRYGIMKIAQIKCIPNNNIINYKNY